MREDGSVDAARGSGPDEHLRLLIIEDEPDAASYLIDRLPSEGWRWSMRRMAKGVWRSRLKVGSM